MTLTLVSLIIAVGALICNVAQAILFISLLHPKDDQYAELAARVDEQDKMLELCAAANRQLFRYMEGLDDATGGFGHHVLLPGLRSASPGGDQRASHREQR